MNIVYHNMGKSISGKTDIKHVSCNGKILGIIKWDPNWRRYCFYPETRTVFDAKCLQNITNHLNSMMTEYYWEQEKIDD